MSDLAAKISALSPEQRALLEMRLRRKAPASVKLQAIPRRTGEGPWPLTYEQERLWLIQEVYPEGAAYNISNAFLFSGPFSATALTLALKEMLQRHEILRTAFVTVDGRPAQVIGPVFCPELPTLDLRRLPAGERLREGQRAIAERNRQPFDLAAGQPWRVTLLRLTDEEVALLATMHHIATDWWSFDLFQREIVALYADFSQGRPPSLPELPIQFADFAVWQREWLQGEVLERQLAYWREQLEGAPTVLDLPLDRPRPAAATFRGARQEVELPADLAPRLKALGRGERVTGFIILLAAFAALLSRQTGQDDLLVGTPVADRGRPETERLIGYFLNMLVLRLDPGGRASLRALLSSIRETVHGAYAHQDLPFGKLLDALRPERSLNRMPLFQAAFVYVQASDPAAPDLPQATLRSLEIAPGTSRIDLTLLVDDKPQGLRCTFEHSVEIFDPSTIHRLADHFAVLLATAIAEPDRPLAELPFLGEAGRQQALFEWNDTPTASPGAELIHRWIEVRARERPAAVAVEHAEGVLSYGELDRRANALAHHLRALGVGPESRVGLYAERSGDLVVGLLAVLKAGGAYVPLDPAHPGRHIRSLLVDAGVSVLLTQAPLAGRFSVPDLRLVLLEEHGAGCEAEAPPGDTGVSPDNLAYALYTSGSTGRPKGVLVPHRTLLASTAARVTRYGEPDGRFLLLSSHAFDSSVAGLFGTLCQGGTLVLPDPGAERDPQRIASLVRKLDITRFLTLPSLYALVLAAGGEPPARLRAVIVAGEVCPPGLVARHRERWPGVALYNEYGPTEVTVWSSVRDTAAPWRGERVPIGRPIPGARQYVVDRSGEPVPIGVPGEIRIGGAGVARGYLDRPDLTAERFLPDPFGGEPGARLYCTGDRGRWLAGGDLEFLGRRDLQVKVRGVRVELGEVESALERNSGVREAVVTLREDAPGEPRLVAYAVVRGEVPPTADELRRRLRERLPAAMVPAAVVLLPQLPRTPNGKVDRRALPPPGPQPRDTGALYVAPRDDQERALAAVWQEVLEVEELGIDDNFFDAGGSSLLLPRLLDRLEESLGLELTLAHLFQHATVRSLAESLAGTASGLPGKGHDRAMARKLARGRRGLSSAHRLAARTGRPDPAER